MRVGSNPNTNMMLLRALSERDNQSSFSNMARDFMSGMGGGGIISMIMQIFRLLMSKG